MMSGPSLLEAFREHRSETAFASLVRQYSGLVFSAARRRVGNAALAEDVAQSVFLRLAQTPPRVSAEAELAGWLHRTTLHVSIDHWRSESRRRARECVAGTMLNSSTDPDPEILWNELAPHLDQAVDGLPEQDRQAVLLRFFERRSMRELGEHLGVSEAAAKMRISRALEKLRQTFAAKGIVCGTALLGSTLSERALEPVSEALIVRWSSIHTAALRGTVASLVPATSGTLSGVLSSLTGIQLTVLVTGLLLAGWGIRRWIDRPLPSANDAVPVSVDGAAVDPVQPVVDGSTGLPSRRSASAVSVVDLDEARRLLREVLQNPPSSKSYPPPKLTAALSRFGDQVSEAMPILVEAAGVPDYETKVWAFSGIQRALQLLQTPEQAPYYGDALALAQPVLGKVLLEERAPGMLKMSALMSLLPPVIQVNTEPSPSVALDSESLAWIERALHSTPSRTGDDGFRFTIIDLLLDPRRPDQPVQQVIQGLAPMLAAKSPEDRLLASFALAMAPGEKPTAVKAELLKALRETSTHSYRAARALASLGPDATDTVPELLEFAKKTREWGDGGYARAALESACRLQPELRSAYPEIDQSLKQEEQAQERMAHPKGIREQILEWAAAGDEVVVRALTSSIQHAPDNESATRNLELLTRALQAEIANATPDERIVLERVLELVRTADLRPIPNEEEPVPPRPVDIRNLLLDARIVLADTRPANEDRIEKALEHFQAEQVDTGNYSTVTPESFAALAKILGDIDPKFRAAWHKTVLQESPSLDRVIPRAKP